MLMKAQPLAYNKDNQEDKEPLFDTANTILDALTIYADMLKSVSVNEKNMKEAALKGYATATDLADYLVIKGVAFRDAHEIVAKAVNAAIKLNDTSAVAYDMLGLIYTQRRNYTKAIDYYNQSIELDPKFAIAYYNRGMAYRLSGNETKALTDFDRAWQMAQTDASLYFLKKENDEALGLDTGEYQGIDTNYTDALINRAVSSKYTGDLNGALADVNKAIALNDRDAVAFNTRGNIYMLFGEYQNAISDYSNAIDIDGNYAKAYYNRALARIIVYANSAACSDLRTAAGLGFYEAEQKRQYFCRGG